MPTSRAGRRWFSPGEALFLVVLLAAMCTSCQAGVWKAAGDTAGKGSFIGVGAASGAALGGPLGAVVGALLGYLGVESSEVRAALDDALEASGNREREHAEEVRQAQARGQQQGSDQASSLVALLAGDQEAAAYFNERARDAVKPLENQLEEAKRQIRREQMAWVLRFLALLTLLGALYWWKQRVWDKRGDQKIEAKLAEHLNGI